MSTNKLLRLSLFIPIIGFFSGIILTRDDKFDWNKPIWWIAAIYQGVSSPYISYYIIELCK